MMFGCFDSVVIFFQHPVDILIWFELQYMQDIISVHMVCYL